MVTLHGYIFRNIEHFWSNVRRFAFYNRTIFEIFFISLYAVEQAFLVWYSFNSNNLGELVYVISMFAVIILTTFSLHKLIMESRIKFLEEEIKDLQLDKFSLESHAKDFSREYNELIGKLLSESLNINKLLSKKRGGKDD